VNFHNVQDAERAIDTMNFTDIRGRPCRIMWSQRDPSVRKSGVGNIFIKNLPAELDHKNLFDLFSVFGNILSCKVAVDSEGVSKGYGYIHYETAEAAQEAINKFNGNSIDENTIEVVPFVRRGDRSSQVQWTNTYVKQFPKSFDEEKLKELVRPYGEVASIAIMRESDGTSKGFGFINFVDHEGASKAVEALNKHTIEADGQSHSFYIGRAQKKTDRQRELQSQFAQKREEKLNLFQGRNLYVKNIDDEVTDEELLKIFSEHGAVSNAKIMRDPVTNVSKGFGFVCYNLPEDAQKAISALNGTRIKSKPLVVTLHQRKDVRRVHLQQSSNDRYRFLPQAAPNMPPMNMPYMMVPGAQGAPFPGAQRQQFYNPEFPRGAPSPRGMPVRNTYYPVPPYGVQPGQQGQGMPMQGQQAMQGAGQPGGQPQGAAGQQPVKRYPNGQPMQGPGGPTGPMPNIPGRGGAAPTAMGGRGQMPVPGQMPRGAYPVQPQPGRGPAMIPQGMPGQQMAYPGRGQPMPIQFTKQVRNQPMGMPGMPQQMDMSMGMQPMPGIQDPLDASALASLSPQDQKNMIGERLYPLVQMYEVQRAGKITGMLLEMESSELLNLIESPDALQSKVREAMMVLEQHERSMTEGLVQ
jgi:polyadenylate-binding protein